MPNRQYSSAQRLFIVVSLFMLGLALLAAALFTIVFLTSTNRSAWTTTDGEQVPDRTILTLIADDHCGWESATLLHVGMPLGTVMESGADVHQYIRDPEGVFLRPGLARSFTTTYNPNATLPSDAEFSGFKRDGVELWISQSELDTAVYMVDKSTTERWPKADPIILCS